MKLEKINFTTEDKLDLFGILHQPDTTTDEVVIFIHGIHSNCFRKKDDIFGEELCKNNVAYFTFNNRGANTITKIKGKMYGSAYEEPTEWAYDISAAIKTMKIKGYTKVHLLGHSLGSSKVLYWYKNSDSHEIQTVGLLSLTDSQNLAKKVLNEKYDILIAQLKKQDLSALIPQEAFSTINILPLSVGTFLKIFTEPEFSLVDYNKGNIDNLNKITEPVFMRFGTVNEFLVDSPLSTVTKIKERIIKDNIDISYIEDADHSYHGKEEILINEYIHFLKNNR